MRFGLSYSRWLRWFFTLLGAGPARSRVEVDGDRVEVRMGVWFRASFPRAAVASARHDHDSVLAWGVHWRGGAWLVNGSSRGIVRIELEPRQTARIGPLPVRLRVLRVGVEDPDGLLAALGA